jgi:hypothetical protein
VYQCVSESNNKSNSNKRIYDDDKNSNFSTFLINRDERQRQQQQQQQLKATATQRGEAQRFIAQNEKCKLKYVNDSNNNQVKSELVRNFQSCASSLPIRQQPQPTINKSDDIKITRVIIRHLEPSATSSPSPPPTSSPPPPPSSSHSPSDQVSKWQKRNILDDNDFSFIDSSSQSVSRSSSTSFASDDLALGDASHLKKLRIPKISNTRINKQQELRTTSANNIYSHDRSLYKNDRINGHHHSLSEDEQQPNSHQLHLKASTDQTIPDYSVSTESCDAVHYTHAH